MKRGLFVSFLVLFSGTSLKVKSKAHKITLDPRVDLRYFSSPGQETTKPTNNSFRIQSLKLRFKGNLDSQRLGYAFQLNLKDTWEKESVSSSSSAVEYALLSKSIGAFQFDLGKGPLSYGQFEMTKEDSKVFLQGFFRERVVRYLPALKMTYHFNDSFNLFTQWGNSFQKNISKHKNFLFGLGGSFEFKDLYQARFSFFVGPDEVGGNNEKNKIYSWGNNLLVKNVNINLDIGYLSKDNKFNPDQKTGLLSALFYFDCRIKNYLPFFKVVYESEKNETTTILDRYGINGGLKYYLAGKKTLHFNYSFVKGKPNVGLKFEEHTLLLGANYEMDFLF